jgi:hypothetical protein
LRQSARFFLDKFVQFIPREVVHRPEIGSVLRLLGLIGLKTPLIAGEKIPTDAHFEKAGNILVTVLVQTMSATQAKAERNAGGKSGGGMANMEMK